MQCTEKPCPDETINGDVGHPVQTIMSRTGSFPLGVAYNILEKHTPEAKVVFDPFCGKGTTLLAARMLGKGAYGMDVAPESVMCSLAKVADVTLEDVLAYIESLPCNVPHHQPVPLPVMTFYHEQTLSQIMVITQRLLSDHRSADVSARNNGTFVLATLLGILHGHASYSLSLPCAHAFSMAPSYVAKYAAAHGLERPLRDVKACLREKVVRCLRIPLPKPVPSFVKQGTVLSSSAAFPDLVGKVDVILTSPPYLNAQTYPKDNWLRLWFLGYDYRALQEGYIATNSVRKYGELMARAFEELERMLKPGGRLICIAGDVELKREKHGDKGVEIVRTGEILANLCEANGIGLRVEARYEQTVESSSRYLHALNKTNGHAKHSLVERIFVARKGG